MNRINRFFFSFLPETVELISVHGVPQCDISGHLSKGRAVLLVWFVNTIYSRRM